MRKGLLHRRKKAKKRNKMIMWSLIALVCLMEVGYSAFQTNITLTAKGNIKQINAQTLRKEITTNGDGLYKDSYENGRYIYRGQNPNNYINFNDEMWRIISIETDNTLKIMRNESIGKKPYDEKNYRNNGNNAFCIYDHCNVWAKVSGTYQGFYKSGTVSDDSTLNTYLNDEYLSIIGSDKKYIADHEFNVGGTSVKGKNIEEHQSNEKRITWNGKIGLITVTDYLKSSLNSNCLSINMSKENNFPCKDKNYLSKDITYRIITPAHGSDYGTAEDLYNWYIHQLGSVGDNSFEGRYGESSIYLDIFPVIYLSSSINLKGRGQENNPYKIIDN